MMLRSEKEFVHLIELDRAVDIIYADLVEKLYDNEISWEEIEQKQWKEIDASLLKHDPRLWEHMPYRGRYQIISKNHTERSPGEVHHLLKITMEFYSKGKQPKLEYTYFAVVKRKLAQGKDKGNNAI